MIHEDGEAKKYSINIARIDQLMLRTVLEALFPNRYVDNLIKDVEEQKTVIRGELPRTVVTVRELPA